MSKAWCYYQYYRQGRDGGRVKELAVGDVDLTEDLVEALGEVCGAELGGTG